MVTEFAGRPDECFVIGRKDGKHVVRIIQCTGQARDRYGIQQDVEVVLVFIEKWLLPAINACPADLAHNISNAARMLEGLPFDESTSLKNDNGTTTEQWKATLLGQALIDKIAASGPVVRRRRGPRTGELRQARAGTPTVRRERRRSPTPSRSPGRSRRGR